jgi:hypothetical protein
MTEEDLKEFLDANKADIQEQVRKTMIERLLTSHQWEISSQIATVVKEFVAAEIVPEVKAFLADNKGPLVEAACKGAAEMGDALSQAIVERTAKKLKADSYEFRQVMKALLD